MVRQLGTRLGLIALLTLLPLTIPVVPVLAANVVAVEPGKLTLTQALREATHGTVITVSPGTYSEATGETFPLIVPAGVELKGDPANRGKEIFVTGGGRFLSVTVAGQNVTIVAERDSKITGLTITNSNKRGYGLWIEGTNAEVTQNTFTGSKNDGVMVTGPSQARITSNYFYKNSSDGITILGKAQPVIIDNLFEETGFALNIDGLATPRIESNTIRNCVDGVVVLNKAQPIFRGNRFEYNQRAGVAVVGEALPDLGTPTSPGNNLFIRNGTADVNNAKRSQETILAYGNQYTQRKMRGKVATEANPAAVPLLAISDPPVRPVVPMVKPKTPPKGKPKSKTLTAKADLTNGKYYVFVTDPSPDTKLLKTLVPTLLPRSHQGQDVLQVGVFGSAQNAKELVDKLSRKGFKAITQTS
ncbi:DUF1565 domain-containing protein [Candidatus Cyanaurora vandensis]|uniref:DUF1565 domain-containing protein n=1 Tax=Candidatus Cyanaurora vandensis TaxID=2714958 RepID=UPI00257CC795|nr:DUF1565 domain-containing protein [Candidatus Cyanaurora vandensis]